jgi:hypothetical protein
MVLHRAYYNSEGDYADEDIPGFWQFEPWTAFKDCRRIDMLLPQIKLWELAGPVKLLTIFDLSGARSLIYTNEGDSDDFKVEFLPAQTGNLVLDNLYFGPTALSQHGAHLMTNLTTLELINIDIEGSFQLYLTCPRLKALCLRHVTFSPLDAWPGENFMPLSDALRLQDIPELEQLDLESINPIDGKFAEALQYCSHLRTLTIEYCPFEEFISSLTKVLADSKAFPSLQVITIRRTRAFPDSDKVLREEFARYSAIQRPEIVVYCPQ